MKNFISLWRVARLAGSGDSQKVIAVCEGELARNPDDVVLKKYLSLAYEANGDYSKALQQAVAILACDRNDELALRIAGGSLAKLERHDEAAEYVASYLRVAEKQANQSKSLWDRFRDGLKVSDESKEVRSKWIAWARDYQQWSGNRRIATR